MKSILLARRAGEADYDEVYSFIGGKMEHKDSSFIEGAMREKSEEIGSEVTIRLLVNMSHNVLFTKSNGDRMVLPHYVAVYVDGEIKLNEEYSDFIWVKLEDILGFEPKVDTIVPVVCWAKKILDSHIFDDQFTVAK